MNDNCVTDVDFARKLRLLGDEVNALAVLAYRLGCQIRQTIAALEAQPRNGALREAGRQYLATVTNASLREDLIAVRGARGAAHFRTKLNADLEALRGRRHPAAGTPTVNTNGNGAHAA